MFGNSCDVPNTAPSRTGTPPALAKNGFVGLHLSAEETLALLQGLVMLNQRADLLEQYQQELDQERKASLAAEGIERGTETSRPFPDVRYGLRPKV